MTQAWIRLAFSVEVSPWRDDLPDNIFDVQSNILPDRAAPWIGATFSWDWITNVILTGYVDGFPRYREEHFVETWTLIDINYDPAFVPEESNDPYRLLEQRNDAAGWSNMIHYVTAHWFQIDYDPTVVDPRLSRVLTPPGGPGLFLPPFGPPPVPTRLSMESDCSTAWRTRLPTARWCS